MTHARILFIAPVPPPITGQAVACEALHGDLVRRGHEVALINLSKHSFRQGVNSLGRLMEIASVLLQTLRHRRQADLIYLTPAESKAGNLKDLAILVCLGSQRRRTFLHLHGGAGMRRLLTGKRTWLQALNAWLLRRVGGVIVLGERHVSIYSHIVEPERIHIVKNFAGDEWFVNDHDLAEKWAVTKKINVLFLSNLLPGKGHQELLKAIQLLNPEERSRFHFDFAGGFEDDVSRRQFLKEANQLDCVTYHGTVASERKRALLQSAHLFCLPTYYPYEGQPISILEAYAAGCAVITTDHSGIFDIFSPSENGWAVAVRSADSIAQRLRQVAVQFDAVASIGRSNARVALAKYQKSQHLLALRQCLGLEGHGLSPAAGQ